MGSRVENRRSNCSLPVAADEAFAASPQSGLAWFCFLLPSRPGRELHPLKSSAFSRCTITPVTTDRKGIVVSASDRQQCRS